MSAQAAAERPVRATWLPPGLEQAIRCALDRTRGDSHEALLRRRALLATLDKWSDGEVSTATAIARVARLREPIV